MPICTNEDNSFIPVRYFILPTPVAPGWSFVRVKTEFKGAPLEHNIILPTSEAELLVAVMDRLSEPAVVHSNGWWSFRKWMLLVSQRIANPLAWLEDKEVGWKYINIRLDSRSGDAFVSPGFVERKGERPAEART